MCAATEKESDIFYSSNMRAGIHEFNDVPSNAKFGYNSTDWTQFVGLSFTLPIEENFDHQYHRQWHDKYWLLALVIDVVYVISIFWLQQWMRTQKAFQLRKTLAIWNGILSIFSVFGSIRLLPELSHVIYTKGFYDSICCNCYVKDVRLMFWLWLFTWSKVIELGDTVFIVLRKQKLIALHWIHHTFTLFSCFYVFSEMAASARWFASMNYFVHSYMYGYYALKALRVNVPRVVSMVITTSQIAQMTIGLIVNYITYHSKASGKRCDISLHASRIGFTIYAIFFCLFLNFFIGTYLTKPVPVRAEEEQR